MNAVLSDEAEQLERLLFDQSSWLTNTVDNVMFIKAKHALTANNNIHLIMQHRHKKSRPTRLFSPLSYLLSLPQRTMQHALIVK